MKKLFVIAFIAAAVWFGLKKFQESKIAEHAKEIQQAPVGYVQSLQQDVAKARRAEETANKRIQQDVQEIQKGLAEDAGK